MTAYDRLIQLIYRLEGYLRDEPWVVVMELAVCWIVVYIVFRFLRGTRGAGVIKGAILLLVLASLVIRVMIPDTFERLNYLYENFIGFASLALVIVFQPELRRALVKLGGAWTFGSSGLRKAKVVEGVIGSVAYLSENKIGALIVIERDVGLQGIVETATRLDSLVSEELLNTIFWPGSALHDMAVVIRGDRIVAAGVQLPLAEAEQFTSELGSRHRAACGLSTEADAMVIVVSEETGTISLAEQGRLTRNLTVDGLRTLLLRGLGEMTTADSEKPA